MIQAPIPRRKFPSTRMRRGRHNQWSRQLLSENTLHSTDLIWPLFVIEGENQAQPIDSMPGINRLPINKLIEAAGHAVDLDIPLIAIFPVVDNSKRTENGEEATKPNNLICRAVRAVKEAQPNLGVMCDVALDPYTSHGHDGIFRDGIVINDETIKVLCQQAKLQAEAGCDIVAPSDMMDGRVGAIRSTLDSAGYQDISIMAYAAKYASAFYGPFREALGSTGHLKGGKDTYQMNPANSNEALQEVALDISEGADMVMIKPGMLYLDIVYRVKQTFGVPTFAYQVSGEYAMLTEAIKNNWLPENKAILESLIAFKRAGADGILTYFANTIAQVIQKG